MSANLSPPKIPLTVRLDDELLRVVKQQAARTGASLGSVVADAARQALLPQYRQLREAVVLRAVDKCFNRLVRMDEDRRSEHELLKEMLAMFVRSFYTHTPPVLPERREEAMESAARRFEIYLRVLNQNLRDGRSLMDPTPTQELIETPPPTGECAGTLWWQAKGKENEDGCADG